MSLLGSFLAAGLIGGVPATTPDASLDAALDVVHKRCFECHATGNVKGGLSLDSVEGWKKSIDAASPGDSELLYRLRLPADDVDAMPPKGDRVAEAATARLETWIREGAELAPIEAFLSRIAAQDADQARSLSELWSSMGATVFEIRTPGNAASTGMLSVSWSHRPTTPTVEQVQRLASVAERTLELSFAGTQVSDEVIAALPGLPALDRVHLERTKVTDQGVAALLERAPNLRYLNLHSTAVSAELLRGTPALARLPDLILFNTQAEPARASHPFAGIVDFQPRRLLAVDRAKGRVVLLREVGLDTYELLWEHDGTGLALDGSPIYWLGGTRSKAVERRSGTDDGHGRVALQLASRRFAEFDTRDNQLTRDLIGISLMVGSMAESDIRQRLRSGHSVALPPWDKQPVDPEAKPKAQLIETDAAGEVVWTFTDVERFPQGFTCVQVIERTP